MAQRAMPWVIKPLVADEVYTDRQEFLDFFYNEAHRAATRRSMSTVLLGRRRMGKTEIFKRVVNRLFFEQDPLDPMAAVPIYYTFAAHGQDEWKFAEDYLENFIRYYVGFYTRQPKLITGNLASDELLDAVEGARSLYPFRETLDWMLRWYRSVRRKDVPIPVQTALHAIRRVSDVDDTTIVVFLDEFQNTRLSQNQFDIVGYLQEAVESPTCPHFVTGSAMSILAREIIGRGALFGRFESKPISALSAYWGTQQALRSAQYFGTELTELIAPLIAERCGDLLEYLELGGWFRKTDDPILLEFLKVWGRIEVEGQNAESVQADLVKRYRQFERRFTEYQGYLAKVFMSQVLFNSQDKSKLPLPGRFFNSGQDIPMRWPLSYVRHRVRLGSGPGQEIDLLAAIGGDWWVCQSKWVTGKKIGVDVLHQLLAQAEAVRIEYEPIALRMWLFAHDGLTKEAERLARKEGILWSNRQQLDELLTYLGLHKLPML